MQSAGRKLSLAFPTLLGATIGLAFSVFMILAPKQFESLDLVLVLVLCVAAPAVGAITCGAFVTPVLFACLRLVEVAPVYRSCAYPLDIEEGAIGINADGEWRNRTV
jgi:hypothetical protein